MEIDRPTSRCDDFARSPETPFESMNSASRSFCGERSAFLARQMTGPPLGLANSTGAVSDSSNPTDNARVGAEAETPANRPLLQILAQSPISMRGAPWNGFLMSALRRLLRPCEFVFQNQKGLHFPRS